MSGINFLLTIKFVVLFLLLNFYSGFSQDSFLDLDFGINGIVIPGIEAANSGFWSISLQQDKKIILTGWAYEFNNSPSDISVIRLNQFGRVDTTFFRNGLFSIGDGTWEDSYASAIQNDGKILIGGRFYNGTSWDFIVIRFNENGTIDSSFGINGIFINDFFGKDDRLFSLDIQPDGKIVACGFAENFDWDFAIVRLNPDGNLDSTFGDNGSKVINIGSYNDVAFSIKVQDDGKIITCGWTYILGSWDFALVRLNSDGSLDNSFGLNGIVTTDYHHQYNTSHSVTIQSDGKYVAAGYISPESGNDDILLIRYNTDGTIDKSFGQDGFAISDYKNADDFAWVIKSDQNDKLLVGGLVTINNQKSVIIRKYNPNGEVDYSFCDNGIFTFQFTGEEEEIRDLVIQPDGKILAAGYFNQQGSNKAFVLRLDNPYRELYINSNFLLNNYPNPFNNSTNISYIVPLSSLTEKSNPIYVQLKVYDLLGNEIETLVDDIQEPGLYNVTFPINGSTSGLSSGIYFYRLELEGKFETRKMVYIR